MVEYSKFDDIIIKFDKNDDSIHSHTEKEFFEDNEDANDKKQGINKSFVILNSINEPLESKINSNLDNVENFRFDNQRESSSTSSINAEFLHHFAQNSQNQLKMLQVQKSRKNDDNNNETTNVNNPNQLLIPKIKDEFNKKSIMDYYPVIAASQAIGYNVIIDNQKNLIIDEIANNKEKNKLLAASQNDNNNQNKSSISKIINIDCLANSNDKHTCSICFEVYDKDNNKAMMLSCGHEFCISCIQQYLNTKINLNALKDIICPHESCKIKYTDNDIKCIVNEVQFEKMLKFRRKNLINMSKDMKWCINPNCELAIKVYPGQTKITCECGMMICLKCNHEWHESRACSEVIHDDYRIYEKNNEILNCPQCMNATEKSDGCNHMTCSICGYEWCWLCKGEYIPNHYSTLNPFGCPGLQGGQYHRMNCNVLARYLLKIGICLLWIILTAFIPVIVLGISIIWPLIVYYKTHRYVGKSKFREKIEIFGLITIGFLSFPIVFVIFMILTIIPGTCIFISRILKRRKRLKEMIRDRRNQNIYHPISIINNNNELVAVNIQAQYDY